MEIVIPGRKKRVKQNNPGNMLSRFDWVDREAGRMLAPVKEAMIRRCEACMAGAEKPCKKEIGCEALEAGRTYYAMLRGKIGGIQ